MIQTIVIYKRDSNGGIRTWQAEVDNNKWRTIAGGPGRKPVTSGWTTCTGKQGRTDAQQAMFEADSSKEQKLKREYRRTAAELAAVPISPMLAKSYDDFKDNMPWPSVFCQPKLDGIRALISRHGAFSREYQPHLNVEHILEALEPVWHEWPGLMFDGELYNHDFKDNFGRISSIVRKQNPTPSQRDEAREYLQYHIYDIADDTLTFGDRHQLMKTIGTGIKDPGIVFVVTSQVTCKDELDRKYGEYLQDGYEGQMVRLNNMYEPDKRSKSLLKRKEFITAEFKLLRIEEGNGNWAGLAKRVVFELPDGRECGAGIRGNAEGAKDLLLAKIYGGVSTVTIRHFTPTPDGVPRFPVAVDFHFGGRKD